MCVNKQRFFGKGGDRGEGGAWIIHRVVYGVWEVIWERCTGGVRGRVIG